MLVVSDVQDVFVPLLDGFLVKVSESEPMIDMYVLLITVLWLFFYMEYKSDTACFTFTYHTWQFIISTIFTITTCIFSYSFSLSF